ncbi:Hsp20/alpha crystallin family protein [Myxococcota bacterium]|nr:Hsp20/alpha crystallin family protein [Myxococcota bacterium]
MLTRWGNLYGLNHTLPVFDELRQQMDHLFKDLERGWVPAPLRREGLQARTWPKANLFDQGERLLLTLQVPGLKEENLTIEANAENLTVRGERKVQAPEGYRAHRQERASLQFSRSIALPVRIDVERVTATLQDGILSIEMAKAQEVLPRKIEIHTSAK